MADFDQYGHPDDDWDRDDAGETNEFCQGPYCTPEYAGEKQIGVTCPLDCPMCRT